MYKFDDTIPMGVEDRPEAPFVEESEEARAERVLDESERIAKRQTMMLPDREHLEAAWEEIYRLRGVVADYRRANLARAGYKDAA